MTNDENAKNRLESINAKVDELKDGITEYDDTIVRQNLLLFRLNRSGHQTFRTKNSPR